MIATVGAEVSKELVQDVVFLATRKVTVDPAVGCDAANCGAFPLAETTFQPTPPAYFLTDVTRQKAKYSIVISPCLAQAAGKQQTEMMGNQATVVIFATVSLFLVLCPKAEDAGTRWRRSRRNAHLFV